jgi:hypothetical protein
VLVIYLAPLPRGFLFGLRTLARFRSRLAELRRLPSTRLNSGSFVGSDFAMPNAPDFQPMYNAIAAANTSWSRVENAMASLLEWLLGYSSECDVGRTSPH